MHSVRFHKMRWFIGGNGGGPGGGGGLLGGSGSWSQDKGQPVSIAQ